MIGAFLLTITFFRGILGIFISHAVCHGRLAWFGFIVVQAYRLLRPHCGAGLPPTYVRLTRHRPSSTVHPIAHPLQVVVAHDLDSGMVCRPEYGAMYGEDNDCESSLTRRLLPRLPPRSLLLADGNFGIFIIAYEARMAGHDVLFRLSRKRFAALLEKAKPCGERRWEIAWRPSSHEREKYGKALPAHGWPPI